jgi:arylsulfatase A-like enzyme
VRAATIRATAWCAATLSLSGAAEALLRGLDPFRLAALDLLALLPAWVWLRAFERWLPRAPEAASGVAAGTVLWLLGIAGIWLRDSWAAFTLRPAGIIAIGLAGAFVLGSFASLRALLTRLLSGREVLLRPRAAAALVWLPLVAAAGAVRFSEPPPLLPSGDPNRPNLVLVTVETLRADHLSAYGYREHLTSNLDRVAIEGARFDEAYASAPWTLASLASVMTSLDPSVLGVGRSRGIPPQVPTLASRLAEAGYRTHAVVTNVFLSRSFGFDRGFHTYDHLHDLGIFDDLEGAPLYAFLQRAKLKWLGRDARRVTGRALEVLRQEETRSGPFFLWVHYFDPHQPYGGPHALGDLPCGAREAPEIGFFFDDARRVLGGERRLAPVEQRHLVHLYDSDIRFLDREIGPLLDALDRPKFARNTLLVVTADHGEEFWDRGGYEHGHSVYREVTRVPLFVRWPGRIAAGTVVSDPVSLLDVTPTLLWAAGVDAGGVQGRKLPFDGPSETGEFVLSENILYGREKKALRDGRLTAVLSPEDGGAFLYDRHSDPGEHTPVDPSRGAGLLEALARRIDENRRRRETLGIEGGRDVGLTRFQLEQLRALGYLD